MNELVSDVAEIDIMIAPTFTALFPVYEAIRDGSISVGAQNMFWEKEGAYTGEISAAMLISAGCRYVIIGHSERREYFGESNENGQQKNRRSSATGLIPIMCIGESEKQREAGETFSVLDKQLKMGLKGLFADA